MSRAGPDARRLSCLGALTLLCAAPSRGQDAAPAAPPACAIAPRTLVRTAVGEGAAVETCWAMPDSFDGAIFYMPSGGRWTPAAAGGSGPRTSDPRWLHGAEHIFVPGVTFDALATPQSEDVSQLWFDWRAPSLVRLVKGQGLVLVAGRTQLVMREGDDLSLGRNLTVADCAQCATSSDPLVREGAAWMLGWIPVAADVDEAARALGVLIQDPVDDVALVAIESLGRVGRASEMALLEAAAKGKTGPRAASMTEVANFLRLASLASDEQAGAVDRLVALRAMGGTGLQHLFLKRFRDLARTKDVWVAGFAVASSPNQRAPGPLSKSFFVKSGIVAEFRAAHALADLPAAPVPAMLKDDAEFRKWLELLFKGQPADLYQRALPLRL